MAIVSRLILNHPDLGDTGGTALHTQVEGLYQKLGDNLTSRFMTKTTVAGSGGTQDFEHNFRDNFVNLRWDIYTVAGANDELTLVTDGTTPSLSDFTVAAKTGDETTHVTITNNHASGQDIAFAIEQDPINLRELVDVDLSTAPEDAQALVYNQSAGQWVPGSSGDASFKLQSLTTNSAVFKLGAVNLGDGKQLNLASDLTIDLKTEVNTGGVTAPANSTRYYIYLDLNNLPAQTTAGATDRLIYEMAKGTSGQFVVLAEDPESVDLSRYVHLAVVKTDGSGDYTEFENLAFREHQTAAGSSASSLVETVLSDRSIGTVGAKDNSQGALEDADFPTPANAGYWHLNGDALNDGTAGGNLTEVGSPAQSGKGFYSREDLYQLDGTDDTLTSSDSLFDVTTGSFTMGLWVKAVDFSAGNPVFMAKSNTTGDQRSYSFFYSSSANELRLILSSDGLTFGTTVSTGFDFTDDWHHVVAVFDNPNDVGKIYVDGQLASSAAFASDLFSSTSVFAVGANQNGTASFLNASIQDAFFTTDVLTDDQVNSLYSKRFSGQQIAAGHVLDADSWPCSDLTDRIYFWNLAADANDDSGNAKNLTNNGATPFTGLNIHGAAGAAEFNGTSQYFNSTDAAFGYGDSDHSFGGWIYAADWTPATSEELISQWNTGTSDRSLATRLASDGLNIFTSLDGTAVLTDVYDTSNVLPGWHHLAVTYTKADTTVRVYLDAEEVLSFSNGAIHTPGTPNFLLGSISAGGVYFAGKMQDVFSASPALSAADIKKLYASRLDLGSSSQAVPPDQRMFYAQFEDEAGQTRNQYDLGWLLDQRDAKMYVDFGQEPVGGKVSLRLHESGVGAVTVPVKKFDKTYTSTPPATIAHGLPDLPTSFTVLHDELANGVWAPLIHSNYLKADATNLYTSGWPTVDATHPLRIVAMVGQPSLSTSVSDNADLVPTYTETAVSVTASNGSHILAQTSGGILSVTYPATPNVGDTVVVYDADGSFDSNTCTIGRNGQLIESAASNVDLTIKGMMVTAVFVGGSVGWKLFIVS